MKCNVRELHHLKEMCGQRAFFYVLQADLIWPLGQSTKQKWTLTKINMSGFFVAGTWKELLPFPTRQGTIHRPEVSFGFFLPQASGSGLRNSLSKADILAGEGPQTPYAMGGRLPASPGPGGWSLCFPEPPANPRLKRPLGSPAQNTARAASRVEGQGFLPSPAENRQPHLEPGPKPQSQSSSAAIICVSNKERYLHSYQSCWLHVSAQTVAASEVCSRGKSGDLTVLFWVQETLGTTSLQVCVHQQH